jgi:hypothetical protein
MLGRMSAARPVGADSPEVVAFRKAARGEPLSEEEGTLLAKATRKVPSGTATVLHAAVVAELEERERVGK